MALERAPLPLAEVLARAERLLARSPADATSIAWVESGRGSASEGARSRRADLYYGRTVAVRVRWSGRTGSARTASAEPGELEAAVRQALADARAAAPSPDWDLAAAAAEPPELGSLHDPAIAALEPGAVAALLQGLAEKRATLALRWTEAAVAVVGSFHSPRAARLTEVTLEARTGRRPGSGFAAASARRLDALDAAAVVERARALEAPAVAEETPAAALPILLAPEAAAVLLEAWVRRALSGRRALETGSGAIAAPAGLADRPLDPTGVPFPFDLDGLARRDAPLEAAGLGRPALDLELAARCGAPPTGHGFAADDAWPLHATLPPGAESEAALRRAAGGGLRIGALEQVAVAAAPPWRFRAVARSVRKIGFEGELGAALAPLAWEGGLDPLFGSVEGRGDTLVRWAPRPLDGLGAVGAPALRLAATDGFQPRPMDR